ncbi:hypothetical protein TSMEX_004038 [Taenia solium]|eukprot:TsM_000946700 transcript=TsM_000946700 gene=TsM_000946700
MVQNICSGNRGLGGCWHGPKAGQSAQYNMATQVTETGSSNKQSIAQPLSSFERRPQRSPQSASVSAITT